MRKLSRLVFTAIIIASFGAVPTMAEDYIVSVEDSCSKVGLTPLIEEAGIYITTRERAEYLYNKGEIISMSEDSPLQLEPVQGEEIISQKQDLSLMAEEYNDPYYNEQVYFSQNNIKEYIDTYKPAGDVKIAVIDSGINTEHQEFANTVFEKGYNLVTDTEDTFDTVGHGTLVAGIIAAGANDGMGIAGIAPRATIVPLVSVCDVNGERLGKTSHLIRAIKLAVDDYGCKIINASLGTSVESPTLNEAVEYALGKGVIIIGAAGNNGSNGDSAKATALQYPASCEGCISVGAVNADMSLASYSQRNNRVDTVTFGGRLYMPSNTGSSAYKRAMGTSFATPVITGITALFVSNHRDITPEEYALVLKGSGKDIGDLGKDDYRGYGIPDMLLMEEIYNGSYDTYVTACKNETGANLKIMAKDIPESAVFIESRFKDGCMESWSYTPLTFDKGFAWINVTDYEGKAKYFIIKDFDSLKSLSSTYTNDY